MLDKKDIEMINKRTVYWKDCENALLGYFTAADGHKIGVVTTPDMKQKDAKRYIFNRIVAHLEEISLNTGKTIQSLIGR